MRAWIVSEFGEPSDVLKLHEDAADLDRESLSMFLSGASMGVHGRWSHLSGDS